MVIRKSHISGSMLTNFTGIHSTCIEVGIGKIGISKSFMSCVLRRIAGRSRILVFKGHLNYAASRMGGAYAAFLAR